jgi:hypothetical protein
MKKLKQTYRIGIVTFFISLLTLSCASSKNVVMANNKTMTASSDGTKQLISAPIVAKSFVKKNGQPTEHQELYIQRSIQDYFIKFCESSITRQELEEYLLTMEDEIKIATLEVEILDGNWDICDENFEQQSRIGEYMIIHRIINDSDN